MRHRGGVVLVYFSVTLAVVLVPPMKTGGWRGVPMLVMAAAIIIAVPEACALTTVGFLGGVSGRTRSDPDSSHDAAAGPETRDADRALPAAC